MTTFISVKTLGGNLGEEGLALLCKEYNGWSPKMENKKLPNLFPDWLLKDLELTWMQMHLWDYFRDVMALSMF